MTEYKPFSFYQSFFSGSIVQPTSVSGNNIIIDKDTVLTWPSFYVEGSTPLDRIMNISVIGDFNVYLPDAYQSNLFSDSLIINVGPKPLQLYDSNENFVKKISGSPPYVYVSLSETVPYKNPFFTVSNPTPPIVPQIVDFYSTVSANYLYIKGVGENDEVFIENLKLTKGVTAQTSNKYKSFDMILNTSRSDLPSVTAEIPRVIGAEKWLYIGNGTADNPTGITLPVGGVVKAELKQTFDAYRKSVPLKLTYTLSNDKQVRLGIYGYQEDGNFYSQNINTESTAGTHVFETIPFSSVINIYRAAENNPDDHGGIITYLSLVYPAQSLSESDFIIVEKDTLLNGHYTETNYQPAITPRRLNFEYTIPANSNAGTVEIRGQAVLTPENKTSQITENIQIPSNQTGQPVTKTIITKNYYSSIESINPSIGLSKVKIVYPSNNGYEEVVMIDLLTVPANKKITEINNPQLHSSFLKISAKRPAGVDFVTLRLKGTNSSHSIIEEDVTLDIDVEDSTKLTAETGKYFSNVLECLNDSEKTLEDFSINWMPSYFDDFFHVDTDLFGEKQDLDNKYFLQSKYTTYLPDMRSPKIFLDPYTDPKKNPNYFIGKMFCCLSSDYYDAKFFINSLGKYGQAYPSPENRHYYEIWERFDMYKGDVFIDRCYDLNLYYTSTNSSTSTQFVRHLPNVQINYPLPFLPPNKYTAYSSDAIKLKVTGKIANGVTVTETLTINANSYVQTSNVYFLINSLETTDNTSNFSFVNKACSYNGNEYPDIYVMPNVNGYMRYIGGDTKMEDIYNIMNPKLFYPEVHSYGEHISVTGITSNFEEKTINIGLYSDASDHVSSEAFLFVSSVKSVSNNQGIALGYAPNGGEIPINYVAPPPLEKNNATSPLNVYVKNQQVPSIAGEAILQKLPPPNITTLEVWCDSIIDNDTTESLDEATICIEGTENPAVWSEEMDNDDWKHPLFFTSREFLKIKPQKWIKTTKSFLYLFNVSTLPDLELEDVFYTDLVPNIKISGLRIRNLRTIEEIIEYKFNNVNIVPGSNAFKEANNPPSTQGLQQLIVHGNNGAQVFISGKANTQELSETIQITENYQAKTYNKYNFINYVENVSKLNEVKDLYVVGQEIMSIPHTVFLNNSSASAAKYLPLNGNPPSTEPPKKLFIQASNDISTVPPHEFLYVEGVDSEDGTNSYELVKITNGKGETENQYYSISRVVNVTGHDLLKDFSIKTESTDGIVYYFYTMEDIEGKRTWKDISFGAFLSSNRGRTIAGNGLFFKDGTLNEKIPVVILKNHIDSEINHTHNASLLVCSTEKKTTSKTVRWTLPKSGHYNSNGMFVYVANPLGSPVNVILTTVDDDCFNCDEKVKNFTLTPGESTLLVCIKHENEKNGWATICGNNDLISAPTIEELFPVVAVNSNVDESFFVKSNNCKTLNCFPSSGLLSINLCNPVSLNVDGYNISVMNQSAYTLGNVMVSSKDKNILIDGEIEKPCNINTSYRLIAVNKTEHMWVSVGGSTTNINRIIIEKQTNVYNNPKTIEIDPLSIRDNDFMVFPENNYYKKQGKRDWDDTVNYPGYMVKLPTKKLYPGFRFSVANYSPTANVYEYVNKAWQFNSNLAVSSNGGVRINNTENRTMFLGPWWIRTQYDKTGYGSAPCTTIMFDGVNWWNVRS